MPLTEPTKLVLKSYGTPGAIAGVAPTLDYRFALDRNEIDAVTLTDKLTVTRAATAAVNGPTGYLELVGSNVARFDHNLTTHQSLGLLVEEARTNLLSYSEEFNNVYWTKINSASGTTPVVTANYGSAPDGTLTADRIVGSITPTAGADYSLVRKLIAGCTGDHTFSVWLKSNTGSNQVLTIKYTTSSGLVTVTPEWQRFTVTVIQTNFECDIGLRNDAGIITGNTMDVLAWGAQLEEGSTASTYIQTTNSAVPRTESATINGTGVITGTYTMVEKPAGCAVVNGTNIDLQTGYTAERVMVFPAALSGAQITAIRSAM